MANLTHTMQLAETLLSEQNLIGWKVGTMNSRRTIGQCDYSKKLIRFSMHVIPELTDDGAFDTIAHEVAHAIAGHSAGHGPKWQQVCHMLGGSGKRLASAEKFKDNSHKGFKYIGTCPNGHTHYKVRKPKGNYSCAICSNRFDYKNIINFREV